MTGVSDLTYGAAVRLENRWTDVFRRDPLVHLGVMGSIVAATFQGYLKDRIGGPLPYAFAEMFFIGAVLVWFAGLALRHEPIRGPRAVPAVVLVVILLPATYLLHPGTPLTVELAGLRGWAEFPVACLMALTVIRTPGQMRAYVGLVLALCVITALYGIWQYRVGPESVLGVGELAQLRHGQTIMYAVEGQTDFRAISTFTFPGPFAAFMSVGIFLAAGIAVSRAHWRARTRLLMGLLILLFFVGIVVSGTRAAMIMTLIGLAVLGRYRGLSVRSLALLVLVVMALYAGTLLTSGRAAQRFESVIAEEGLIWGRVYAPIYVGMTSLAEQPFGLGLGRSAVGVPFFMVQSYPEGFFRGADGEIGRAAVELGVFGILLLAIIAVGLIPYAARATRALRHTEAQDIALGTAAFVVPTAILFLVGTPISSVPQATIWWFMLGGLLKLWMLQESDPASLSSRPR